MQNWNKMRNTSGYIFKWGIVLLLILQTQVGSGQDTLRTFGPRIGMNLARFAYIFFDPSEIGAEFSVDMEVYRNLYPVVELGYSSLNESEGDFDYALSGAFGRFGVDYNVLQHEDRSMHHSLTVGARYGLSVFSHRAENVIIPSGYWGDFLLESYENNLTGHWIELVGAIKAELVPNLFMGWSLRYKILFNPEMDPLFTPLVVPGYGKGTQDRGIGFTYSIFYKIPLLKQ
jgi:hypothetical protein